MNRKLAIGFAVVVALCAAAPIVLKPPSVPAAAIKSSVTRDPALLARAWALPTAATYKHAVTWQSNGSVCGPSSVANAMRSLGEPASTEREVLAGTGRCWSGMCFMGLTLDQLADVARAHTQRKVTVLRDLNEADFKRELLRSNDPSRRYLINFSRKPIFGAGGGHHSPIAGYLEKEDLVFVLDVNQKFQPWLIERPRLFAAMDTKDGDKKRGLLLIE